MSEQKHPLLVVHTNADLAYLHYFPAERHPGFQAVGGRDGGGEVTFWQEGQGQFCMPSAVVVTVEKAYAAAAQFFNSGTLPSCVEWTEL